ncbi:MAG: 16S rRNA (adenine(1518)-N(6)/adenine(1519)-N(6))-dimethyltransferase RsmA [candidate division WOR-3 bacterium]
MFSDIKSGDFRPRKSLGQTFLTNTTIADALIAALNLKKGELVLEIGPGSGILTERLLKKGARVIAVEIDRRLVQFLKEIFANNTNLKVVYKDFLKFDLSQFSSLKIIGNIPFNISSQVFFKLWEYRQNWIAAVFTTQREFAQRLLSPPGTKDYGILSVLYDYLCEKRKLFNIPARFFYPQPKVSATAFLLKRYTNPVWRLSDEKWFYQVVQSAFFPQRRKRLLNNLCQNLKIDKEILLQKLNWVGLGQDSRAEDINFEQFALLSEMLLPFRHTLKVRDSN